MVVVKKKKLTSEIAMPEKLLDAHSSVMLNMHLNQPLLEELKMRKLPGGVVELDLRIQIPCKRCDYKELHTVELRTRSRS